MFYALKEGTNSRVIWDIIRNLQAIFSPIYQYKNMSFEISGKLYKKFDTNQISDTFKKREFVLEVQDGSYPQLIKFQLLKDRCSLLDPCNEGDELKLSFNISGREYTKPNGDVIYFTNLDAWRIESAAKAAPVAQPKGSFNDPLDFPTASDEPFAENTDDLPF